jgi:hypothetical protein
MAIYIRKVYFDQTFKKKNLLRISLAEYLYVYFEEVLGPSSVVDV